EFVELAGISSYTWEDPANPAPNTLLSASTNERGIRFTGPETTFAGIDPLVTEVIVVANSDATRRIPISIGQTGTATTSGNRLFSLDFTVDAITFSDPLTTNLSAQIGAAMSVGAIVDNGDGTYDVPMTVTLEGFSDVSLFDLQITNNLAASFGTYVASTPAAAGTYTVSTPTVGTLTGGAVVDASSPNASFDGSSDQNLLELVSGNVLPVGATAEVDFTVTWFPPVAVTSTTNQATGRGDISENGTSDGSTTDLSHEGNDPDPDSDGPGNNSTVTTIDVSGLPVELEDFTAIQSGRDVTLTWKTYSESGNSGFDVEHDAPSDGDASFRKVAFVAGAGDSQEALDYRFELGTLEAGSHRFRLRQNDFDGSHSFSEVLTVEVELAERFMLEGAYPNPFNPVTTIRFALKESGPVKLAVFDVTGRQVRSLAVGDYPAGSHQVRFEAGDLPSGLYVYRLVTAAGSASMPVVLLK
ncbi:MAG: T9SS type A sorting domain-containing protein, partial [Rhodothermales bacterium]|nr:T9SS type A sorting domain-containing protein [Rhodothermales bacterium]